MKQAEITATFGPAPGDRATLSRASQGTIEAIYQHPLAHNLEWSRVVSLFEKLGTVDEKAHNEIAFSIGGEHHRVRKPRSKDLTATEVMTFRHMLSRAGWAPLASGIATAVTGPSGSPDTSTPALPDLLAVVDHHEARLYHLDLQSPDPAQHVIRPTDTHHLVHPASRRTASFGTKPPSPRIAFWS